jgi:hypothetical protein
MTPPRNVPKLAENLRLLMGNEQLRQQFAEASLAYSRNFGIDIMLDRMDQAFRQAITEAK